MIMLPIGELQECVQSKDMECEKPFLHQCPFRCCSSGGPYAPRSLTVPISIPLPMVHLPVMTCIILQPRPSRTYTYGHVYCSS
jgi:hypothetical protein